MTTQGNERRAHPARPASGSVPDGPGVYQFYAVDGRILYVGKAKHLSARLSSYFRNPNELHERTRRMLDEAVGVRWTVCSSEVEALVLESNWIRSIQPPFNVLLRDGSGYPRIAITAQDEVPRLLPWRGERRKGIQYFGPYPHLRIRTLIDTLTRAFPVRTCNDSIYRRAQLSGRPCLLAELARCAAPCVGRVSAAEHQTLVNELTLFLQGGSTASVTATEEQMNAAAERHEFELAARLRDRAQALRAIGAGQTAQLSSRLDADAFATARDGFHSVFAWTITRNGDVVASGHLPYQPDPSLTNERQLSQLIVSFYLESSSRYKLPAVVLVETPLVDPVGELLQSEDAKNGSTRTVKVKVPKRGDSLAVLGFAQRQALEGLRQAALLRPDSVDDRHGALEELAGVLSDGRSFRKVEGIDISHTQGRATIGGLVTFVDGLEKRDLYRRINLETGGGDDYAALSELVTRRFSGNRLGLGAAPDLLLVDGGPAQVVSVVAAIDSLNLDDRPVICGLAKRLEELFLEGEDDAILLPRSSAAFHLVTKVRDAVHANAIRAHRRKRDKVISDIDELPGVGPARRKELLARFGTFEAVKGASIADLQQVQGIGEVAARRIHQALHPTTNTRQHEHDAGTEQS